MFIPYATEGRLDRKLDAWKEREKVGFDFFSVRYLSTLGNFLCQQKSVKVQRVELLEAHLIERLRAIFRI